MHVLTTGLLRVELAPEEHQLYSDVCEYKHPTKIDLKMGPNYRGLEIILYNKRLIYWESNEHLVNWL